MWYWCCKIFGHGELKPFGLFDEVCTRCSTIIERKPPRITVYTIK